MKGFFVMFLVLVLVFSCYTVFMLDRNQADSKYSQPKDNDFRTGQSVASESNSRSSQCGSLKISVFMEALYSLLLSSAGSSPGSSSVTWGCFQQLPGAGNTKDFCLPNPFPHRLGARAVGE